MVVALIALAAVLVGGIVALVWLTYKDKRSTQGHVESLVQALLAKDLNDWTKSKAVTMRPEVEAARAMRLPPPGIEDVHARFLEQMAAEEGRDAQPLMPSGLDGLP